MKDIAVYGNTARGKQLLSIVNKMEEVQHQFSLTKVAESYVTDANTYVYLPHLNVQCTQKSTCSIKSVMYHSYGKFKKEQTNRNPFHLKRSDVVWGLSYGDLNFQSVSNENGFSGEEALFMFCQLT